MGGGQKEGERGVGDRERDKYREIYEETDREREGGDRQRDKYRERYEETDTERERGGGGLYDHYQSDDHSPRFSRMRGGLTHYAERYVERVTVTRVATRRSLRTTCHSNTV